MWLLPAVALALTGVGLLCIRVSAGGQSAELFKKQAVWIVLGLAGFGVVNLISCRKLGEYSYILFAMSLGLLGLLLVAKYLHLETPLLPSSRGVYRWIVPFHYLGVDMQFQPSELAKLSYILALAWYLRLRENYRHFWGLVGPFLLTLIPMGMILLEPDLGTTLLFFPVFLAMLFVAGARRRHLALIVLGAMLAAPVMYYGGMREYQRKRIQVLMNQESTDPYWLDNEGYQLYRSKLCIGTGGWTGHTLDEDLLSLGSRLPEGHNDFVFALIAHHWGFAGAAGVLALFEMLLLAGGWIAWRQTEPFGKLAAVGITALLATQVFINAGMTMGLMPITGMNLPFVSYGGSSMLCSFVLLGLITNVARSRSYHLFARKPFDFSGR
ncbi:MAG: rod shape-determining protein RodA [Sedimentisphaerales bacterium]|nr:rod shape-determining protein RodA [Sedimentisphaerales bacterium]